MSLINIINGFVIVHDLNKKIDYVTLYYITLFHTMFHTIQCLSFVLVVLSSHRGYTSRGVLQKNCTWICLPEFKFWLSLYLNLSPFTTHPYTNFVQKTPNFATIGCVLPPFAQNTPNLCKLGAFICDENPSIAIPKSAKKCAKRQTHIHIPSQCNLPTSVSYGSTDVFWPFASILTTTRT